MTNEMTTGPVEGTDYKIEKVKDLKGNTVRFVVKVHVDKEWYILSENGTILLFDFEEDVMEKVEEYYNVEVCDRAEADMIIKLIGQPDDEFLVISTYPSETVYLNLILSKLVDGEFDPNAERFDWTQAAPVYVVGKMQRTYKREKNGGDIGC